MDHISEMSDETRTRVQFAARDFPVNALVVTARLDEPLGGMQGATIRPLRIAGATELVYFMEQYLHKKGMEFTDEQIYDGCSGLSKVVGTRHITPLLAKLYADQMIPATQGSHKQPGNIPDLMLSYLNKANDGVTEDNKLDNPTLQRDAKIVAWECVGHTYQAAPAELSKVTKELINEGRLTEEDARTHLTLSQRLRVIQVVGPSENSVRFTLDPLAEYLGGLHAVDVYGENEELWRAFLTRTDTVPGAPKAISGFLLAVRECCLAHPNAVTTFVISELDRLASAEVVEISDERRAGATVSESGKGAEMWSL